MTQKDVRYELREGVAMVGLDDGRANALSHELIGGIHGAFDRAEGEAGAVLLVGRPGRFCAGFELAVMRSGPEAVRGLVRAGAELLVRMCELPLPIVAACTGHALAAGALLLLAADRRLGARGDFKIGLNEVGIGMTLPHFAIELARQRLSKRHFVRATTQAEIYDSEGALDAGYLDLVTEPEGLLPAALAEATRMAGTLQPAYRNTKRRVHEPMLEAIRGRLDDDLNTLTGPSPT